MIGNRARQRDNDVAYTRATASLR